MQRSRRAVLAGIPALLADCGRSFRPNEVPGGLAIRNRRDAPVTVRVRAAPLPPASTPAGGTETSTPPPETPLHGQVVPADVRDEFDVAAGGQRAVPEFSPQVGRWAVEASVSGTAGRTRITLYAAVPGPTGADTVLVTVTASGVRAEATTVD